MWHIQPIRYRSKNIIIDLVAHTTWLEVPALGMQQTLISNSSREDGLAINTSFPVGSRTERSWVFRVCHVGVYWLIMPMVGWLVGLPCLTSLF